MRVVVRDTGGRRRQITGGICGREVGTIGGMSQERGEIRTPALPHVSRAVEASPDWTSPARRSKGMRKGVGVEEGTEVVWEMCGWYFTEEGEGMREGATAACAMANSGQGGWAHRWWCTPCWGYVRERTVSSGEGGTTREEGRQPLVCFKMKALIQSG
ncbi:hypothetical protein B0H13DRAFT_1862270 [Mycena leptocephala]|nr:hypothetical protein B0H13DRAFT_1862270 [Mycena leptocephala]